MHNAGLCTVSEPSSWRFGKLSACLMPVNCGVDVTALQWCSSISPCQICLTAAWGPCPGPGCVIFSALSSAFLLPTLSRAAYQCLPGVLGLCRWDGCWLTQLLHHADVPCQCHRALSCLPLPHFVRHNY